MFMVEVEIYESLPILGLVPAIRFLAWVDHHPHGIITLPTGRTPEYFIHWLKMFKTDFSTTRMLPIVSQIESRISCTLPDKWPKFDNITFIQMDEFLPFKVAGSKLFSTYVKENYIELLGIQRAFLMNWENISERVLSRIMNACQDLLTSPSSGHPSGSVSDGSDPNIQDIIGSKGMSLLLKIFPSGQIPESPGILQRVAMETINDFCDEYEKRIVSLGGIGFFLGGLGPDGHIAFISPPCHEMMSTNFFTTNYPTMAANADALGGVGVEKNSVQFKKPKMSVMTIGLQTLIINPSCYFQVLAAGEAKGPAVFDSLADESSPLEILSRHLGQNVRLSVTEGAAKCITPVSLNPKITRNFIQSKLKAANVLECGNLYFHFEPHHDDILLGYWPFLKKLLQKNSSHYFFTCTPGYNSVSDSYLAQVAEGRLVAGRDVADGGIAVRQHSSDPVGCFLSAETDEGRMAATREYFAEHCQPKMSIYEKKTKIREFESLCCFRSLEIPNEKIHNLNLGFYTPDLFTPPVDFQRDVLPIVDMLKDIVDRHGYSASNGHNDGESRTGKIQVVVTVALDPEGAGPDTHFKSLCAITDALVEWENKKILRDYELIIVGYRNVWTSFDIREASAIIPVSESEILEISTQFNRFYVSQKNAEFPSPFFEGSFGDLAVSVLRKNKQIMRRFLPEDQSAGYIFLKILTLNELKEICSKATKYIYGK